MPFWDNVIFEPAVLRAAIADLKSRTRLVANATVTRGEPKKEEVKEEPKNEMKEVKNNERIRKTTTSKHKNKNKTSCQEST